MENAKVLNFRTYPICKINDLMAKFNKKFQTAG